MSKSNSFKKSRKLALGIAVAMGCSMASVAFADQTITEPIIGPDNLPFSENVNVEVSNNLIAGGPWLPNIGAAVSASEEGTELSIDMGNNALSIIGNNDGHSTGIAAINKGKVEITSTGDLSVYAESTNGNKGQTAALFVNGGGQILIHNDDNVLSLNGTTGNSTNGAVVKAMNGAKDTRSYIKIDGLVDINAKTNNGVGMSEAVSAVASTIDIGGGKIFASKKGVNPGLNYGFAENCAIRAYGEFVSSNYGIVNVNVVKDGDALDAKATGAGDKEVQIFGDFNTVGGMGTKGTINVGLNTSESYWVGDYIKGAGWGETPGDYGSVNLFMGNQARWLGNASFATNVKMSDPGTLWQGYSLNNAVSAEITNGAAWYNYNEADTTALLRLAGSSNAKNAGLVYMTPFTKTVDGKTASYNTGNVSIANYAGNMKVFYKHDAQDVTNILGGNFTINHADEGSAITLTTDNSGFDVHKADETKAVLGSLANKLYYQGAVDNAEANLNGYVQIAEGLTAASAGMKLADVEFSAENGQASLVENTVRTPDAKIIYGSSETAMMKGAKSAMASGALMWRAENNDLLKRMGDLRLDDGEAGIWAKYYGGKYEMDSQNTDLNLKYNAYQVGFDKAVGNGWSVGLAVSYNDGDSNYGSGKADLKDTSVGLYGTWKGNDGQYVDLIAKYTRMENDYDVANVYGHKLSGDYKTWGTSISAEYGKRFENESGFYFDPSVELTLGRINGKDYSANSDYLDTWGKSRGMQVQQDAFNTLVGRVGFRLGQQTEKASYFVKLAAAHEFKGEFNSRFAAEGEPEGRTSIDFGDTWYEAQIGCTAKLSENSLIYADFERSFGGDVEEKWRVDAGLRFTF